MLYSCKTQISGDLLYSSLSGCSFGKEVTYAAHEWKRRFTFSPPGKGKKERLMMMKLGHFT